MDKVIVERCCGNCEWSISPDNEHDIMIENSYEEDDPTRPRAGDCCLGIEHNCDYVCSNHEYLSGGLETYSFYDDSDMNPGYYVVCTYCDHILKYFKLYRNGERGIYSYSFSVVDFYPIKNEIVKGVSFEISKEDNELLYTAITTFAKALNDSVIWDNGNKSFMSVNVYDCSTGLYFTGTNEKDVIDVEISDINNINYKLIVDLFRKMEVVTSNRCDEVIRGKIRKLNK